MPEQKNTGPQKKPQVTTSVKGLQVADSPLNGVKLDLGLFILVGLVLFILLENITVSQGLRFTVLGIWALFMLAWVVFKTQAIIKKTALQGNALHQNSDKLSDSESKVKNSSVGESNGKE